MIPMLILVALHQLQILYYTVSGFAPVPFLQRRNCKQRTIITTTTTTTSSSSPFLFVFHTCAATKQQTPCCLQHWGHFMYTQVICDVDDTLKSSGGVNVGGISLGGIDVQYERGESYPGVQEFVLQISLGPTYFDDSSPIAAKPAILTARAEEFKSALELKPDHPLSLAFQKAGNDIGLTDWGLGPVLYGSVTEWILQHRKGLRKFCNFEKLLQQDPSRQIIRYVFVGDTGELDQEAGETMLREYPDLVKAVFLHVVSGDSESSDNLITGRRRSTGIVPIPAPQIINGRPLVFFRTYVGAAVIAVKLELMSLEGLDRVVKAATEKLAGVPKSSDKWTDLQIDLERATQLLRIQ